MAEKNDPLVLDFTGYRCPVPVIKLEAAIRRSPEITSFEVATDDPVAVIDVPHFCREAGLRVEKLEGDAAKSRQKTGHNVDFCVFMVTRPTNRRKNNG